MDAGSVMGILFVGLWLAVCTVIGIKLFRSKLGPVKTVKAVVVSKNKTEIFSKYAGNGKTDRYVVVFETGGKRISFYVSAFSYGGYRIGETGTLQYRGNKLIRFG